MTCPGRTHFDPVALVGREAARREEGRSAMPRSVRAVAATGWPEDAAADGGGGGVAVATAESGPRSTRQCRRLVSRRLWK